MPGASQTRKYAASFAFLPATDAESASASTGAEQLAPKAN
ncbi:hypothetical protein CDS [Bradyrhizobium sp.]|nr:hypothetical protein CDS [Bradyrhizobium sp.]